MRTLATVHRTDVGGAYFSHQMKHIAGLSRCAMFTDVSFPIARNKRGINSLVLYSIGQHMLCIGATVHRRDVGGAYCSH